MIQRFYGNLETLLERGKVLVLYGPRRVGKTTLVKNYLIHTKYKYRFDTGDNIRIAHLLGSQDLRQISEYVSDYELIVIDEAQQISGIGLGLKMLVDHHPNVFVIATGSSSFDLANQIGEPLVGRKYTHILYPVAFLELQEQFNRYEFRENLSDFLIFGLYPDIITAPSSEKKIERLEELVNSYLLKDILSFERLKGSKILFDLLKLLAFQIGQEVALHELGTQLGLDLRTVQRYLDLLEKSFIVIQLRGLSRNSRKEISKKSKYYFFDVGIRNAVISQYNRLSDRDDIGALWENFLVVERLKKRSYQRIYGSMYFWRTYTGAEIDLVEERDGKLFGFEFKWNPMKKTKEPKSWRENYKNASWELITSENFLDFIL